MRVARACKPITRDFQPHNVCAGTSFTLHRTSHTTKEKEDLPRNARELRKCPLSAGCRWGCPRCHPRQAAGEPAYRKAGAGARASSRSIGGRRRRTLDRACGRCPFRRLCSRRQNQLLSRSSRRLLVLQSENHARGGPLQEPPRLPAHQHRLPGGSCSSRCQDQLDLAAYWRGRACRAARPRRPGLGSFNASCSSNSTAWSRPSPPTTVKAIRPL
jgi:hypothetical protein